ncbi:hypothetical protein [uncultured Roseibium sp.]|uniref:hypothetical protein n=1 Tax=uncultured Roseibium sp. TaxID=1936171 RepID=UPI0026053F0D|nr:hypothetical protein [uncultured Roseibium sp.]
MLIKKISEILHRLAPHGWADLMTAHGLDINAQNLTGELIRPLQNIDRSIPGFQDLSPACTRAVEPGAPARSLLFHALASPEVHNSPEGALSAYPSLADLDTIENYIYAAAALSLEDVEDLARQTQTQFSGPVDGAIAIVVLSSEYRSASNSVHGGQADKVYSRTGIARAGTLTPNYNAKARGHWPASDEAGIHVVPSTWSAYICTKVRPDRTQVFSAAGIGPATPVGEDINQPFWTPIHKLFDGQECLVGETVALHWLAHHENTKIARIHKFLDTIGEDSRVRTDDLNVSPFAFTEGLADLSNDASLPPAAIVPVSHPRLIDIARNAAGLPVTFKVPKAKSTPSGAVRLFWSSLEMRNFGTGGNRPVPEYVHIRHVVDENGDIVSLNNELGLKDKIETAGYDAVHYVDFTGAGYVTLTATGLSRAFDIKAGHSVIAAPDFYPKVDQRQVQIWQRILRQREPELAGFIRWESQLAPLSANRLPANPAIGGAGHHPFARSEDDGTEETVSALIAVPDPARSAAKEFEVSDIDRCSTMPDAAAGIFAPGWAISTDATEGRRHLAAYGLGSPFPEDSKLCAALSAFWPAAAPDTTRTYEPGRDSVVPMADDELAHGSAWDGINGITLSRDGRTVEFPDRDYADYTESSLNDAFDIRKTAAVTFDDYVTRALRTAQVRRYLAQNPSLGATNFLLASFTHVPDGHADLAQIQSDTSRVLTGSAYRFKIITRGASSAKAGDHRRRIADVSSLLEIVAAENGIAHRDAGSWMSLDSILFV